MAAAVSEVLTMKYAAAEMPTPMSVGAIAVGGVLPPLKR